MFFADLAHSHAVLPAFILGLVVSHVFAEHRETQRRFRVVAFAFLTPCFFLKGGMNVSVGLVSANLGLLLTLLTVKLVTKSFGVYPAAIRYLPSREAMFTTLLMSTGLTFGTISSLYGLRAGIFDQAQFSVVVTVVVLSAVIPTLVAQGGSSRARWMIVK
jgi:Kef-type K+ transport system membrane component KefB